MKNEKLEIQVMDYMSGAMTANQKKDFEKFLKDNPVHKFEVQKLIDAWSRVDRMGAPEPSEEMDTTFFEMLSGEMEKQQSKYGWRIFLERLWPQTKPQLAFGMVLLGLGIAVGYLMNTETEQKPTEKTIVANETESVRQKLVLTLLEQPSANQRLQGVSEANKFKDADEIVIQALLQTLNKDSNVNVRLAAIESLTNYVDNAIVRQGLVQSIPNQESPILQVTLANLMVALQEKASVEPFKKLLKERELDTTVQKKIKSSIESII